MSCDVMLAIVGIVGLTKDFTEIDLNINNLCK